MTSTAKPARAPSEGALSAAKRLLYRPTGPTIPCDGRLWVQHAEGVNVLARAFDDFAAHRLSTALPVVEAARRHVRSFEPGTLSGSELNLACELRDMDGDIWEPWCVPGELVPTTDALLNPSEPTFDEKTAINKRVQARYGELMREGKHGHYETLFRVVHEERRRLSTALLDPEVVEAVAVAIGGKYSGVDLVRKRAKDALRAAAIKITGREDV